IGAAYGDVFDVLGIQAVFRAQAHHDVEFVPTVTEHGRAGTADAGLDGGGHLLDADAQLCHAAAVEADGLLRAAFQLTDVHADDAGQLHQALLDLGADVLGHVEIIAAQFHLYGFVAVAAENAVENPQAGLRVDADFRPRDAADEAAA